MIELDQQHAEKFLTKSGIANCEIKKIAGDASFRSYYRIFSQDQKTYVLMFAPPQFEEVKPFIKIAEFLALHNFSAPKIFARDEESGFLLLEDLGDETFTRVLKVEVEKEFLLYQKACDCLLEIHKIEAPKDLPIYNHAVLFTEVMLFVNWYLLLQKKVMSLQEKAQFKFLWFQLFDQLSYLNSAHARKNENSVLVLRDYHVDNLMSLSNRNGHENIGLLDFQDALIGSRAYDLVSLLEDARRDVDEKNRLKIFEYYLQKSNFDRSTFLQDYEILSLQRNIKIVGIFARLSIRDGKHNYLNYLPRVLNFVRLRLESKNEIFSEISQLIKKFI